MAAKRDDVELHSFANPRRLNVEFHPEGPSMTRSEFQDECDVNQIMARYEKNGIWPIQMGLQEPRYVDFTILPGDLQGTIAYMQEAELSFMQLPASIRREFDNDAVRFVEFASDGANIGKLREWGLARPEEVEEPPMRVEVVNPPSSSGDAPAAPASAPKPKA